MTTTLPCQHDEPAPFCCFCRWGRDPSPTGRHHRSVWRAAGVCDLPEPMGKPATCRHLGEEVRRQQCGTCRGVVQLKVFACAVHGECTLGKPAPGVKGCCEGCRERAPTDPFCGVEPVRNLLMHIMPVAGNGVWQRNVAAVRQRWGLFNGRKIVAVCTNGVRFPRPRHPTQDWQRRHPRTLGRLDSPDEVRDAFGGRTVEFIEVPNDAGLREVRTFPELFGRLENQNPCSVTFYCHAKGVTKPVNPGVAVHPWTDILYETCLNYWPLVHRLLMERPLAGSCKKVGRGFDSESNFHYSGSFFWFRDRDVFARDWRRIDRTWWGIEAWPGLHFPVEDAGVLFHEGVVPHLNMYLMDYLKGVVEPELTAWRAEHAADRRAW